MKRVNETELATLAYTQDDFWEKDAARFNEGDLLVPFAYLMWALDDSVDTEILELGDTPREWPFEITKTMRKRGGMDSLAAVTTVAMGTMLTLSPNEKDAQTMLSVANGVPPSAIPGSRDHLISHMKVIAGNSERVIGAPLLDDGHLGGRIDSGYTDIMQRN